MSSVKGIILDYGGTIDTNGIHWGELIWQEYQAAGIAIEKSIYREGYVHGERSLAKSPIIAPTDTFRALLGKKMELQFSYLRSIIREKTLTREKETEIAERCYERVVSTLCCTRKAVEALAARYPMVLVTNFYGNMPVVLREFSLEGIFKDVVESATVGLRKPDPALFALGAERLGLTPGEIAVIGDSYRKDIFPASTLGCSTVWLKKICWAEEAVEPGHEPTAITDTMEKVPGIIAAL